MEGQYIVKQITDTPDCIFVLGSELFSHPSLTPIMVLRLKKQNPHIFLVLVTLLVNQLTAPKYCHIKDVMVVNIKLLHIIFVCFLLPWSEKCVNLSYFLYSQVTCRPTFNVYRGFLECSYTGCLQKRHTPTVIKVVTV